VPEIPGVTQVDPQAKLHAHDEGSLPNPADPLATWRADGPEATAQGDPFQPPSEAVRMEMLKMELEAEIMNAGGAVMGATGNTAKPVGAPSREALEAARAGLLDDVVSPADRDELAERIRTWDAQHPQDDLADTSKE
jgi:hypothetical protein